MPGHRVPFPGSFGVPGRLRAPCPRATRPPDEPPRHAPLAARPEPPRGDPGRASDLSENSIALVPIQPIGMPPFVGNKEVEIAISVIVKDHHAGPLVPYLDLSVQGGASNVSKRGDRIVQGGQWCLGSVAAAS